MEKEEIAYHALNIKEVLKILETNFNGLSSEEAKLLMCQHREFQLFKSTNAKINWYTTGLPVLCGVRS